MAMNPALTLSSRNYLTRRHFLLMLLVAGVVHALSGAVMMMAGDAPVNKIPVHVLNIKLGSGALVAMQTEASTPKAAPKMQAAAQAQQPNPVPPPRMNERVEATQTKTQKTPDAPAIKKAPAKAEPSKAAAVQRGATRNVAAESAAVSASRTAASRHSDLPSQYVRSVGDVGGVGIGSAFGNSVEAEAEVMQRYTQLISIWLQRHKVYPESLKSRGIRGRAVVRLRINRTGAVKYFKIENSTGYAELDDAVATMVKAANPLPSVPANYPAGNLIEFLIPVNYK